MKAVPIAVTVTTRMAVTLFMDTASARLAGQVSILGDQAPGPLWSWGYIPQEMCPEDPLWKGWGRPGSPYSSLPQVPAATCPALRASGEPTVATPAPARMGAPASPRMAIVCVYLDSGVPPARDVRLPPFLPLVSSVAQSSVRTFSVLFSSTDSNLWASGQEGGR